MKEKKGAYNFNDTLLELVEDGPLKTRGISET